MLELEKNLDLIRKSVWGYIKKNPDLGFSDFDDLFAEACLACVEAQAKYDPERGKESTFIYHVVNNRLSTITQRKSRATYILGWFEEEGDREDPVPNPERQMIIAEEWQELYNSLSPKAKKICELVLNDPCIDEVMESPKLYRGELVRQLKENQWSWGSIWGSFKELKQAFS